MKIKRRFVSFATRVLNSQSPTRPYSPPSPQPYREQLNLKGGSVREIHFQINLYQPEWTRNWSRQCRMIVSLVLALVLIPTALVIASNIFSDVPDGHIFHDDINAIYGARITTGRTPTTYVPEDPVLRGEMAAFLHRGLGRVAWGYGAAIALPSSDRQDVAVLTINTGGAPGGTGFLKVDAALSVTSYTTACPCVIGYRITLDGEPRASLTHAVILYDPSEGFPSTASGALTMAIQLPTVNLPQTARLWAQIFQSAETVEPNRIFADGSITALWVPFGATGGNTLNAASAEQGDAPQGTEPDAKPDGEKRD